MGWKDAPVVDSNSPSDQPAWMKAPVVGSSANLMPPDFGSYRPTPAPKKPTGIIDKALGVGDAALAAGSGMIMGPVGNLVGVIEQAAKGKLGDVEGGKEAERRAAEVAQQNTWQPRTETGRDILGTLGRVAEPLQALGPMGAEFAGIPRPPMGPSVRNVGRAIAESPEGQLVGKGMSKVGAAIRPNLDPQVVELARKAEGMGIKVTPDMLSDNKFLRMMGQASRDVPLSGSPVSGNREAFNRMIIKSFGGDENATKISPAVFEKAMTTHGETIGSLSAKHPIPFNQIAPKLAEISANAEGFETQDVARVIKSYTDEITKRGEQGSIDGEAFRKIRTKLTGQMRRTNNGDLKHALSELDDHMLDAIQAQLTPEELTAFNQARMYYANGKIVEPLIAKAASKGQGNMSPAALAGRVTATSSGKSATARGRGGQLADISAVGNRFMTEPPSSGTAERGLVYGGLLGGGAVVEPHTAAGLYGLANLYNRLGPRIARKMIPPPPTP